MKVSGKPGGKKSRYPLKRRSDAPQAWAFRKRENLLLSLEIWPRTVQLMAQSLHILYYLSSLARFTGQKLYPSEPSPQETPRLPTPL